MIILVRLPLVAVHPAGDLAAVDAHLVDDRGGEEAASWLAHVDEAGVLAGGHLAFCDAGGGWAG